MPVLFLILLLFLFLHLLRLFLFRYLLDLLLLLLWFVVALVLLLHPRHHPLLFELLPKDLRAHPPLFLCFRHERALLLHPLLLSAFRLRLLLPDSLLLRFLRQPDPLFLLLAYPLLLRLLGAALVLDALRLDALLREAHRRGDGLSLLPLVRLGVRRRIR